MLSSLSVAASESPTGSARIETLHEPIPARVVAYAENPHVILPIPEGAPPERDNESIIIAAHPPYPVTEHWEYDERTLMRYGLDVGHEALTRLVLRQRPPAGSPLKDSILRLHAVFVLAGRDGEAAVPILKRVMHGDPAEFVRKAAARALAQAEEVDDSDLTPDPERSPTRARQDSLLRRSSLSPNADGAGEVDVPRADSAARAENGRSSLCGEAQHREWWRECAFAVLETVEPTQHFLLDDQWDDEPREIWARAPWSPEGEFAALFAALCEEQRAVARAEGRPLLSEGMSSFAHDVENCRCSVAEHQAWVEDCVADVRDLLPGMRRWEVLERFEIEGGIYTNTGRRFVHQQCPMLKMFVEFDVLPGSFEESPRDLLKSVSPPFLELTRAD